MRAYIDSDILIWHLRGERRAAALFRALSRESGMDLWTGALQRAEVVFFMRPAETSATMSFLSRFKTEPVTQEIVDDAGELYRRWHPTHGIDVKVSNGTGRPVAILLHVRTIVDGRGSAQCRILSAVRYLRDAPAVDSTRMFTGGLSRGGVLSIAYAGTRPTYFVGAINLL